MTSTASKPERSKKSGRKKNGHASVPAAWRQLLCVLPGYDPFAQAKGFHFDAEAAQFAIEWIEQIIRHAKGTLAGEPFLLEQWEKSIVANTFGWKNSAGWRRFREVFIYVPKKNGKTAFAAALLLLVMMTDGELGAEVYSAAASRDQAALIFAHAAGMVKMERELDKRLTVYGAKGGSQMRSIVYEAEMSVYKCLAADANTADGASPHLAIIDELHRHRTPELAEVLQKSTAARAQPLVIYTSTADYNRPSLCNSLLKRGRSVRDNPGDPSKPGYDPAFLPAIYEASSKDDWTDPAVWAKANPNLDVTVPKSFFARECKKAQETPSELNNFLRLHLNIVTDSVEAWLRMDRWDLCPVLPSLADLRGRRCWGGLDLSSTIDITALVLAFEPDESGIIPILPFFWIPQERMHERVKRDKVPYDVWVRDEFVEATPGDVIDYGYIRRRLKEIVADFNLVDVGYDPYNAREFCINQLQEQDGINVVEFRQGYQSMNEPSKRFEALVMGKQLAHGGNPVMRWMASNTVARRDPAGNIKPDKEKSSEKIDGIVGSIMGIGRMMANAVGGSSVYDDRGLFIL